MLLGQDLGRRHQRALPAGVDGDGGRQRGHHRLAGTHVALQQAVHRLRARQVGGDLGHHALLRGRQREGQHAQQPVAQAARARRQRRRAQPRAPGLRLQLRQLLGQQLFKLQPLPGRVAAVFQRRQRRARRRVVQQLQRLAQRRHPRRRRIRRQHLGQRCASQRRHHRLAQIGLRQLRAAGVDRRQRRGQRRAFGHPLDDGMDHLTAEEAGARLAAHAQALAHRHLLLVGGVEMQKAQQQLARIVLQAHQQLAARSLLDAAIDDQALDLAGLAVAQRADRLQPRLVLVAQRQVQRQVDVAQQPQPAHGLHGRRQLHRRCSHTFAHRGLATTGGGGGIGHGTILRAARSMSIHDPRPSPPRPVQPCPP